MEKSFRKWPCEQKKSGVKRYRIQRPVNEPGIVIVELDFDTMEELQSTHQTLQNLWNKVQGSIILTPKTRVIELVESKEIWRTENKLFKR